MWLSGAMTIIAIDYVVDGRYGMAALAALFAAANFLSGYHGVTW